MSAAAKLPQPTVARRVRSEGAYWLARSGQSQTAIAERLGVSQQAVQKWLDAVARPGAAMRAKLAELYSIAPDAWDLPRYTADVDAPISGSRTAPTGQGSGAPSPRPAPPIDAVPDLELEASGLSVAMSRAGTHVHAFPDLETPKAPTTLPDTIEGRVELVERMLRRLLEKAEAEVDATPLESAKLLAAATATLHKLAAMKGELDVSRRVLALPAFKRAVAAVEEALRGHPDAARDVAAALHALHEAQ